MVVETGLDPDRLLHVAATELALELLRDPEGTALTLARHLGI